MTPRYRPLRKDVPASSHRPEDVPKPATPAGVRGAGWIALAATGLLTACGGGGDDGGFTGPGGPSQSEPEISSVVVSPSRAELTRIGATEDLVATARDADGDEISGVSFTWGSSASSVASVDGSGTVTAVSNGATTIAAEAEGVTGSAEVTVRAGDLAWAWIGGGLINSCGVTTHGTLLCWGENDHAVFGPGTDSIVASASPVPYDSDLYFVSVRIGGGHICARSFGSIGYCWGNGFFGERGDGERSSVQPVAQRLRGGHRFAQLTTGGNHSCGTTTDDVAYCWGRNSDGQLGDGTTTDRATPTRVEGGLAFVQISAGPAAVDNHTCGVTAEGTAHCWGLNADGELGDGTTTTRTRPVPVSGDLEFHEVATGARHSCGLTTGGEAVCWGSNAGGQLGDGTRQDRREPAPVDADLDFVRISAGGDHTCALARDGSVYCWGLNTDGKLGDGTTQARSAPVQVAGLPAVEAMDAGTDHVCAVTAAGDGYCWGKGINGSLGNGDYAASAEPVRVLSPEEMDG